MGKRSAARSRVPRSRGLLSGVLLVLLGLWGGLIPFVGPYFGYAYSPDRAWAFTSGRFWLSVLPAVVAIVGGLIMLVSASRVIATVGGWLAALAGAWFVIGGPLTMLWTSDGTNAAGAPVGGATARGLAEIGFFTGLGVLIVFFSALALGRFAVIGVKEASAAQRGKAAREAAPAAVPAGAETDQEADREAAVPVAAGARGHGEHQEHEEEESDEEKAGEPVGVGRDTGGGTDTDTDRSGSTPEELGASDAARGADQPHGSGAATEDVGTTTRDTEGTGASEAGTGSSRAPDSSG